MTVEVRAVIYFFYFLDRPDEDILARLKSAYRKDTVNLQIVQR
jgi:hypothetical protein